jgi:RNA polymerase sigma-70 factor (ECF subfamily)
MDDAPSDRRVDVGVDMGSSSLALLARAQAGDSQALEELLRRLLPRLKTWITGRLPGQYRDLCDTDDLVQETIIRTLKVVPEFEVRHDAGLQVYLRQALWNRLREEIRRSGRRKTNEALAEQTLIHESSPLERVIGLEAIERYESALQKLDIDERSAVVGRLEFGYSYPELALMLGKKTPDAARKLVERAVPKLAAWMRDDAEIG